MALTPKQVKDVCFIQGRHKTCRYLDEEDDGTGKIVDICRKLSGHKSIIDKEVDEFLDELAQKNLDPKSQGIPIGDNCQGYLPLVALPQGYDVP